MLKEQKEGTKYPRRLKVALKCENGREIPVTLSCRSDGECVVLPRSMEEVIFSCAVKPKKAKGKGEKG